MILFSAQEDRTMLAAGKSTMENRAHGKHNTAEELSMPRRSRTQETCKSPFSRRPNVPADQPRKLCREDFHKIGNGTFTLPLCLSSNTEAPTVLNHHFSPKGAAEQCAMKPLNVSTQQDALMCISCHPKYYSSTGPREDVYCTGLVFHLYLCHTGKKNKRRRYKSTHQTPEITSHLYSNFHPMDSHSQNIPPHLPHRCREVAAFHLPTPGRNLTSCRYMKPLPLSAVKVSAVIRNKGQPRAEACLESTWDKHLAVQATNEQYIPPSLSGARALSIVGCKIRS